MNGTRCRWWTCLVLSALFVLSICLIALLHDDGVLEFQPALGKPLTILVQSLRNFYSEFVNMKFQIPLLLASAAATQAASDTSLPGEASFVVPTAFPTSVYQSYYGKSLHGCQARQLHLILHTVLSSSRAYKRASTSHTRSSSQQDILLECDGSCYYPQTRHRSCTVPYGHCQSLRC